MLFTATGFTLNLNHSTILIQKKIQQKLESAEAFFYVDIIVDVMFIIDILINFRTTYMNNADEVSKCHFVFEKTNA